MAYLVIARKWRPKTFAEVVGQQHVTVTLENAIKNNRIASAYLFSGPRGVGKTTTARILAKALNCEKGPTVTPCNECTPCREITDGHSMDVLEIDGASNRGIDEVRSLRESTRYTPSGSRYKIYIIDEVHMLTTEAFNALLKTLEEPPPHVLFIFATTEANKVPATILSRCQRFDFRRIPMEQIIQQLEKICTAEKIEIEPAALRLIARKSEGCMRDSQSLLDQVISFSGDSVKEEDVISLLGLIREDLFFDLAAAVAARDVGRLANLAQQIYQQGYDVNDLLSGLLEHFHDLLILKSTGAVDHLSTRPDQVEKFRRQAEGFAELDLIRMIQMMNEAAATLKRSINPQIHFETLLYRLASLPPTSELQQLFADLEELKKKVNSEPPARPGFRFIPEVSPDRLAGSLFDRINGLNEEKDENTSSSAAAAPRDPVSLDEITRAWPQMLAAVKRRKIHFGSLLQEGQPLRVRDGYRVEIVFDDKNGYHITTLNENRRLVEAAIGETLGKRVVVHCVPRSEAGSGQSAEAPPERAAADEAVVSESNVEKAKVDAEPEPELEEHPLARKLIENLGGEPVEIEPH